MLEIYLICLGVGGVFILITLLFGADTDADIDLDIDADLDAGDAFDGDGGADTPESEGVGEVIRFLSLRNIMFFTAFFGLTGTVLSGLDSPRVLTFVAALAIGLFAAALMHRALQYFLHSEVGAAIDTGDLAGTPAKVVVNISRQQRGKVSLSADGRFLQLLAAVAEEASVNEFRQGESVIVLKIRGGTAFVVEKDFI